MVVPTDDTIGEGLTLDAYFGAFIDLISIVTITITDAYLNYRCDFCLISGFIDTQAETDIQKYR